MEKPWGVSTTVSPAPSRCSAICDAKRLLYAISLHAALPTKPDHLRLDLVVVGDGAFSHDEVPATTPDIMRPIWEGMQGRLGHPEPAPHDHAAVLQHPEAHERAEVIGLAEVQAAIARLAGQNTRTKNANGTEG
jgi:hypothetical protein